MFKNQIISMAQKYCDEDMTPNHWQGRDHAGWYGKPIILALNAPGQV